jgi:hypothetical protein
MDVLVLVYLRDVLRETITGRTAKPKERDVYDHCQKMGDAEMYQIGIKLEAVYQQRSDPLVHLQIVNDNNERHIRQISRKQKLRIYNVCRGYVREALDILVRRYRSSFPEHCTDKNEAE